MNRRFMRGLAAQVCRRLAICAFAWLSSLAGADTLSLAGPWEFRPDPQDAGVSNQWQRQKFSGFTALPGAASLAGGHTGPIWLAREVVVPGHWQNRRIRLALERCPLESQLWVDGESIGRRETAVGPHEYDLTSSFFPGRHRLVLRLDHPIPAMPCLGIAGRMEVTTSPKVGISALRVTPDVRTKTVVVSATIHNAYAGEGTGWVNIEAASFNTPAPRKAPPLRAEIPIGMGTTTCELVYPLGEEAQPWTPARPVLHRLKFWLGGTIVDRPVDDDREIVFGLRTLQPVLAPAFFSLPLARWQLNGEPVLLASRPVYPAFPPAVCPPTEVAAWRAIWAGLRRDGAGHAVFPGWCPPEAAFRAADEAGILLTPAVGGWPDTNRSVPPDYMETEHARLRSHFGHHPSFAPADHPPP